MQPVYRQIFAQAEAAPGKPAIVAGSRTLTYGGLAEAAGRMASALVHRHGIGPGDRVLLSADADPDFIAAYLAVHAAGAVAAPVDPDAGSARRAEIVERLEPALAVAGDAASEVAHTSFADLAQSTAGPLPDARLPTDAPADILFTTGSTGRSKGVVLSHRAIAASTRHINAFLGTGADAIEVLPLPLGHSFGLGRVRCILSLGATLVLTRGLVNPASFLDAVYAHRASGFASVPSGIAILLADGGERLRALASRIAYVEIGSSPMPLAHKKQLMRLLPATRICMHYGLTEASRSAYSSFHDNRDKLDSIGRPSDGVRMRVVLASGEEAPPGVEGRLEISGEHLMSEYWRDPTLTARTLTGGWLRTGDLGRRDDDGFFWLAGRESEVINVGGHKVAPREIEEILLRHPSVAECACAGMPDPQGLSGEMVCVWLVARPGAARPGFPELAKMLRAELESYKIPRRFEWIDELPKSASGKILRGRLSAAGGA